MTTGMGICHDIAPLNGVLGTPDFVLIRIF